MSLRGPSRVASDIMYTPAHATETLMQHANCIGLLRHGECWEPAAGAGHVAKVLKAFGKRVMATDIAPAEKQVHPVSTLDFLTSSGPSSKVLNIITNPPYGFHNRKACAFIAHAFKVMQGRPGSIAMLLPFEFDARASRNHLVGEHPWFVGKVTVEKRIRWVNLPQKANDPMGAHSWFLWSNLVEVQRAARAHPMMVVR